MVLGVLWGRVLASALKSLFHYSKTVSCPLLRSRISKVQGSSVKSDLNFLKVVLIVEVAVSRSRLP